MKSGIVILACLLNYWTLFAQDSIPVKAIEEVIISATRTPRNPLNIPAALAIISTKEIESYPATNVDDLLHLVSGINIDRDFGIFSKNSSISMRGLNASYRSLVLLDGIPLNKADGGGINWNRINPDNIEQIEIVKGAGSALYGGNAMSGIINIITRKPVSPLSGKIKTFYGTYHTVGGSVFLDGSSIKSDRGFYWGTNAFYRQGDGYITEPETTRDSLDAKTYLKEYSSQIKTGYQFSKDNAIEFEYSYSSDKRGDGTKVYEKDGGYNSYPTHALRTTCQGRKGNFTYFVNAFYQLENYTRQNETIKKKNGQYTLYNTLNHRSDAGIWVTADYEFSKKQAITFGSDLRQGKVDGSDNYKTSTDILTNKGQINFAALFAQYELTIPACKIKIITGLRYDLASFKDGSFTISEPSSISQFMTNYPANFSDTLWKSFSPKISLLFNGLKNSKWFISFGKGFRVPTLDDICRNGNITKGFKQANPSLRPENLYDFETGHTTRLFNRINLQQSFFYMIGRDFQYFVATGDSVYTGGDNLKPVLQRQNVGQAEITGTDMDLTLNISKTLLFSFNYAFNHSIIKSYHRLTASDKDLTGKYLMEVPASQFFTTLEWRVENYNASIVYNYRGKQWADDENILQTGIHSTVDVCVSAHYRERYYATLVIQDMFNQKFVDSKGQLSPGRFYMLSFIYKFDISLRN